MMQTTPFGIRQRSILPGRERWEVAPLLSNQPLAEKIHQILSSHAHVLVVHANPLSGRVLVEFEPQYFTQGQIGQLLVKIITTANGEGVDEGVEESVTDGEPATGSSNPLFDLVKRAEGNAKKRRKALALSISLSTLNLVTTISLTSMVTSVLFPSSALTKLGMTKALQLSLFGGTFVASLIAESYAAYYKGKAWTEYANSVESTLVEDTFSHVQGLGMAYLDNQNTEKLMAIISHDTNVIKQFLCYTTATVTEKTTTFAIASTISLFISPIAFTCSLISIPIITKLNQRQLAATHGKYQQSTALNDQLNQILSNNLNGISTVKSFTAEDQEIERLKKSKKAVYDNTIEIDTQNAYYDSLTEFTFVSGMMLPLVYGCLCIINGTMDMANFLILNNMSPMLLNSATGLEQSRTAYRDAKIAAARINKLLATAQEFSNTTVQHEIEHLQGELSFKDITFGYTDRIVLDNVALHIPAQGKVAFVGTTGSGKSTLVKLLMRFYPLSQGNITLGGVNIYDIELKALRQSIALVSQDPYLFNGTIEENLRFGRPDATTEEVIAACKIAQAYDFIMADPAGLNAQIGERGGKLSGGQRQRLSIARAVLKNAAILILDEATSAVDNETEAAIRKSVELISQNCIVIIIAHRLSTIRYVDTIYHIKDSHITESGSHDELLAKNGQYALLWQLQTAGKDSLQAAQTGD